MRRRRTLSQPTSRADSAKTAMRRTKSKSRVTEYSGGVMKKSTTTAARTAASTPGARPPSQAVSTAAAYSKVTPWTKRSGGSGKSRCPSGPVVSAPATVTLTTARP